VAKENSALPCGACKAGPFRFSYAACLLPITQIGMKFSASERGCARFLG